jgi:hypothetical protein
MRIARAGFGAALMLALNGYSGTYAQAPNPSDALLGRWDLVVQRGGGGDQTAPSWLEVERSGTATLVGQFVGTGGSARPIAKIQFRDGAFTFAGRMLTLTLNGTMVICNREIPGITGGALDSTEAEPGPLLLQGDHGPVEFRNIVITPAKKAR